MSAYGTVTRSAPAGRRPPKPSLQIHLFMKNPDVDVVPFVTAEGRWAATSAVRRDPARVASASGLFWGSSFNDGTTQTVLDPLGRGAGSHPLIVQTMVGVH